MKGVEDMNEPNKLQQEMFQNDVAALVSILNADSIGVDLRNLVNATLIKRVSLYFNPTITIKTEE